MVRMAITQNKKATKSDKDAGVGGKESLYTVDMNVNLYSHYGNEYGSSSKTKNRTTIISNYTTLG
jgi:hypothetical protein